MLKNLTGQRFGRLVVVSRGPSDVRRNGWVKGSKWSCRCDCGNRKVVRRIDLLSGDVKSCGCLRRELSRKRMQTHGLSRQDGKVTVQYQSGLTFELQIDDIVIPETCPVFGTRMETTGAKVYDGSPSLDRIRPELGYTKENVVVISYKANRMKSNGTLEEHRRLLEWMQLYV